MSHSACVYYESVAMGVHWFIAVAALAVFVIAGPLEKRSGLADAASKFQWFGINESGPEFGEKKFPGIKDKDACFHGDGYVGSQF